ncbi:MAG: hypothetical protein ACHQ01_05930 [Candidatus Limnocylindrales bacterium]
MQQRNLARELALVVAPVAVLVHWLDPAQAVGVTALITFAAAAGTATIAGQWRPWRWPAIPLALPALAAFSIAGIARVVDPVPWLAIVFAVGCAMLAWVVGLETSAAALAAPEDPDASEPPDGESWSIESSAATLAPQAVRLRPKRRAEFDLAQIVAEPINLDQPELPPHPRPVAVRAAAFALTFLGFVAVGGLIPGGLVLTRQPMTTTHLVEFVTLNAAVAGVAGYRLASLLSPGHFDRIVRVVAVGEYAIPVAAAAVVLRALTLPLFFIPALLTLLVYMATGLRESPEPIQLNRRLLQEMAVLSVAALAVIAWGLMAK